MILFDLIAIFQAGIMVSAVPKVAHRPSNDLSMEQVHDYRQVHPSLTGPYIGHVGYPYLVFPMYRKVTVQYIGCYWIIVFAVRGDPELSLSFGEKPVGPHYPGHRQGLVLRPSSGRAPVQPIVIPTFAYLEHFAHLPDRKSGPVVFYEPIFSCRPRRRWLLPFLGYRARSPRPSVFS